MRLPADDTPDAHQSCREAITDWMLHHVDGPYAFIVDLSANPRFSARERKLWGGAEASYAHIELRYSLGQANVVPGAMTRGFMTAMYWFAPAVYPLYVCKDVDSAWPWLDRQISRGMREYPYGDFWTKRKGWVDVNERAA